MGKKKQIETLKDFGVWNIAESWDEITLEQFQKIMALTNEEGKTTDIIELLSILTGKDKASVQQLPAEFVDSLLARILFLNQTPQAESSNKIEIDGEVYLVNFLEKMKFKEYVDSNQALKGDAVYATILAILCRKEGEIYDDDFIAEKFDERFEMFNKQPITKILPIIDFFLKLFTASKTTMQDFLTDAQQTANQLLTECENSMKTGGWRNYCSIWGIRTLLKLKKYRKCIAQLSSNS